ncbi:uncharacterized protein LOC111692595 [Anoplophora glabripennis]|uniref:uncharacterized protein LOC111692595 n=1 Tax=Anoplophora glabripennis TaxID=217634 RepID=UPI000C764D8F|nr:uncharacterized protein LOC111692595 [Anoplophora glabripennis]
MFLKAYKTTNDKIFRQKVKSFDASALPPCQSELREHILRTAYIAQIWSNAHLKEPTTLSPLDCGWKVDENAKYDFNWFSGVQLPQSIDDVTFDLQNDKDSDTEIANDGCQYLKENDGVCDQKDDEDEDSDDMEGDEESNVSSDEE